MTAAEKRQLLSLIDELRGTVEELLLAGLTTASKATIERMNVSFKEASRMKLLRLGLTLRIANEEIARFTSGNAQFSARRLAFFLGRTWLLGEALRRALSSNDDPAFARLMSTPATQPVEKLKVVTLGVGKKAVADASAAFEFRLRVVEDAKNIAGGDVKAGTALVWSCVFPMPREGDLPAEAFLHLPQKQKFKPALLLEKNVVEISQCAISPASMAGGTARLSLSEASEVKAGEAFKGWRPFWKWGMGDAAARLGAYKPTPLDLEVELQEELFIEGWEAGERKESEEGYDALPLRIGDGFLELEARLDRGMGGKPLHEVMTKLAEKKKGRPPLFGVAHYESCRVVFQPLTALGKDGPEYLTVSPDKISQAALVKAMKFT